MATYKFIDEEIELIPSIIEFNKEPNYHRKMVGNHPKFFVHSIIGGQHLFGLSKFCAFKDITSDDYLSGKRRETNGGKTQKHIEKVVNRQWEPYEGIAKNIQKAFKQWIESFFPHYNIYNANFLTIEAKLLKKVKAENKRSITQDELEILLDFKKRIGAIGEEIAITYEADRLLKLGASSPLNYITHTSKINANAGFDIYSDFNKKVRFIEVKSNVNNTGEIYLTSNELNTFKSNPGEAYIYLVNITNLEKKEGIVKVFDDVDELGEREAILYKIIR